MNKKSQDYTITEIVAVIEGEYYLGGRRIISRKIDGTVLRETYIHKDDLIRQLKALKEKNPEVKVTNS